VNLFVTDSLTKSQLNWIDRVKALALVWIVINHAVERLLGCPYFGNPSTNWPSLPERIAQLGPLEGYGYWGPVVNALRYVGWTGDQAVSVFLIVSGFGLTWGLLGQRQPSQFTLKSFYRRRAFRIYPLWWGAHLLLLLPPALIGLRVSLLDPQLYLSMLGIRITPDQLYYGIPAWWFVGLLLQLYLVFPLLWRLLKRIGPLRLLVVSCAVALPLRGLGLLWFDQYLDAWSRGAVFITRLPEFVFGISLAAWTHGTPQRVGRILRSARMLALMLALYALGSVCSLTLLGNTVAPVAQGVAAFVLMYALVAGMRKASDRGGLCWIGRHSYSLYLVHHALVIAIVPRGLTPSQVPGAMVRVAAALVLSVPAALLLEWLVHRVQAALANMQRRWGLVGLTWRGGLSLILLSAAVVSAELTVRARDPQEVAGLGWGERPALESHPEFGWRLKPSGQTRLRWEGYDYRVTSNSLGFPGPEYSAKKAPGTLRILATGDAFTSAEGVDTEQSWPALLEAELAHRMPDRRIEVLNFAITGYGPNQYASVIDHFAPRLQPDAILIGFFVNEYQDVLQSDEEFRQSIGFHGPRPDGWASVLTARHLCQSLWKTARKRLYEIVRRKPDPYGYFLGQVASLERDNPIYTIQGPRLVTVRLRQIKRTADRIGAPVTVLMIPASVQVCSSRELEYYPGDIDLTDASRFDLDQPQRVTRQIARGLAIRYCDLRPVLRGLPECPYQSRNMHWTVAGHRAVAKHVAGMLEAEKPSRGGSLPLATTAPAVPVGG
jgi:peptidoglycan/LPS O-acetylase OafA/YrhL